MNPYEPPSPVFGDARENLASEFGEIKAEFVFSTDHLVQTLARYRSQHRVRSIWRWVRYVAAIVFAFFAMISLFAMQFISCVFLLALSFVMFFAYRIDNFLACRNFRKSPHYDARFVVKFNHEGLRSSSEVQDSTLKWAAFSKAVFFTDGVLLFQGPKTVHWISDSSLEFNEQAVAFRQLVQSKLPVTHV